MQSKPNIINLQLKHLLLILPARESTFWRRISSI